MHSLYLNICIFPPVNCDKKVKVLHVMVVRILIFGFLFFLLSCSNKEIEKKEIRFVEFENQVVDGDTCVNGVIYTNIDSLSSEVYIRIAKDFADTCHYREKLIGIRFVNSKDIKYLHSSSSPSYPVGSVNFGIDFCRGDSLHKIEFAYWIKDDAGTPFYVFEIYYGEKSVGSKRTL